MREENIDERARDGWRWTGRTLLLTRRISLPQHAATNTTSLEKRVSNTFFSSEGKKRRKRKVILVEWRDAMQSRTWGCRDWAATSSNSPNHRLDHSQASRGSSNQHSSTRKKANREWRCLNSAQLPVNYAYPTPYILCFPPIDHPRHQLATRCKQFYSRWRTTRACRTREIVRNEL